MAFALYRACLHGSKRLGIRIERLLRNRWATAELNPDPLYHDECVVYTMEGIVKTCECAGNLEQAIAWLKQARISGAMVWVQAGASMHIQDKSYGLL
jgi:hypothetical protein